MVSVGVTLDEDDDASRAEVKKRRRDREVRWTGGSGDSEWESFPVEEEERKK